MKKSLVFLLSLLSSTTYLQANKFEREDRDPPATAINSSHHQICLYIEGKPYQAYRGASNLYSWAGIQYPKVTLIHPYNPTNTDRIDGGILSAPLTMQIPSEASSGLPYVLKQQMIKSGVKEEDLQIFLSVQNFPWTGKETPCLRPQYMMWPNAPARSKGTNANYIIAGIADSNNQIKFEGKQPGEFVQDTPSIHPSSQQDDNLILSGNTLHITGLDPNKGKGFWSWIDLSEGGKRKGFAVYHNILTDEQTNEFSMALKTADLSTFAEVERFLSMIRDTSIFLTKGEGLFEMASIWNALRHQKLIGYRKTTINSFNRLAIDNRGKDPYLAELYENAENYIASGEILYKKNKSTSARIQAVIETSAIADALGSLTAGFTRQEVQKNFPKGVVNFNEINKQLRTPGHPHYGKFKAYEGEGELWKTTSQTFFSKLVLEMALEAREKNWNIGQGMDNLARKFASVNHKKILGMDTATVDGINKLNEIITTHPDKIGPGWWKRGVFYFDVQKRVQEGKEANNGSIMHAWPMGIIFHDNVEKAAQWGAQQSYLTHADSTAIAASAAIAAGIAAALQQNSVSEIIKTMEMYANKWEAVAKNVPETSNSLVVSTNIKNAYASKNQHPDDFFKNRQILPTAGFTSKEAIAAAVYIFAKSPENIMEAIYTAVHGSGVNFSTDSNTIGRLAAALVGAHAGLGTLPKDWINNVEDNDQIKELVDRTLASLHLEPLKEEKEVIQEKEIKAKEGSSISSSPVISPKPVEPVSSSVPSPKLPQEEGSDLLLDVAHPDAKTIQNKKDQIEKIKSRYLQNNAIIKTCYRLAGQLTNAEEGKTFLVNVYNNAVNQLKTEIQTTKTAATPSPVKVSSPTYQPTSHKGKEKINEETEEEFGKIIQADGHQLDSFIRYIYEELKKSKQAANSDTIGRLLNNNRLVFKNLYENLKSDGISWLSDQVKLLDEAPLNSHKPISLAEKKEEKSEARNGTATQWPQNLQARQYAMTKLFDNIDEVFSESLKQHFQQDLRNKELVMFDVSGGGDCLGYALQLSRDEIINILLKAKEKEEVRALFANLIATEKSVQSSDWSWHPRAPLPAPSEYEYYINFMYGNKMAGSQRQNLDSIVAKAIGMELGFSVYIWSAGKNSKEILLSSAYYDSKLGAEKHLLLAHDHYSNLLSSDASQEEVDAAKYIENKGKEANEFISNTQYADAFKALKVPALKPPFIHHIKK